MMPHPHTVLMAKQLSVILPCRCSRTAVKTTAQLRHPVAVFRAGRTGSPARAPVVLMGGPAEPGAAAEHRATAGCLLQSLTDGSQSDASQTTFSRDEGEREAWPATPREGAKPRRPSMGARREEEAAAELPRPRAIEDEVAARQQAAKKQEAVAEELARQWATADAEAARRQAAKEQEETAEELARQRATADAEAARQQAAKEQEEAAEKLARQRATADAEAARLQAVQESEQVPPEKGAQKRKGGARTLDAAAAPTAIGAPTAATLAQGMRGTIASRGSTASRGSKKSRTEKATTGTEAAEAGDQTSLGERGQAASAPGILPEDPKEAGKAPVLGLAEASGMPDGVDAKVVCKGGTITRKTDMFKVHIAKMLTRQGKACDAQKKFGGKSTDAQAFAAAKAYIDERVK